MKCSHRKSLNKLLGLYLLPPRRMLKHSLSLRAPSWKEKKDLSLPNLTWPRTQPSVEAQLYRHTPQLYRLHTTRQENLSQRLLAAHRRQKTIKYDYLFGLSENKKQAKSMHGRNSNALGKIRALRVDFLEDASSAAHALHA